MPLEPEDHPEAFGENQAMPWKAFFSLKEQVEMPSTAGYGDWRSRDEALRSEALEDAQEHGLGVDVLVEPGAARLGRVGYDVIVPAEDKISERPRRHLRARCRK